MMLFNIYSKIKPIYLRLREVPPLTHSKKKKKFKPTLQDFGALTGLVISFFHYFILKIVFSVDSPKIVLWTCKSFLSTGL